MIYVEIDEFRMFPDGALARCRSDAVVVRENGQRLGVLITPDHYDLYCLYEDAHWKRPKDERPNLPDHPLL